MDGKRIWFKNSEMQFLIPLAVTQSGWQQWPLNLVQPCWDRRSALTKSIDGSFPMTVGWLGSALIWNKLDVLGFSCNHGSWGSEDMRSPSVFGCQFSLGVFDSTTLNEMFSENNLLALFACCCCIYWRTVLSCQFTRFFPFQMLSSGFLAPSLLNLAKKRFSHLHCSGIYEEMKSAIWFRFLPKLTGKNHAIPIPWPHLLCL